MYQSNSSTNSIINFMFSFLLEGSQIYEEDDSKVPPQLIQSTNLCAQQQGQGTAPNTPAPLDCEKKTVEFSPQNFIFQTRPSKKAKETNPNLIKNLIVALKEWVNFNHHPSDSLVYRLWDHFSKSNKINKNLLLMLYANEEITNKQYEQFLGQVSNLDESCTLEKYLIAQETLRNQTLRQLEEADPSYIAGNRRVQNKEEFKTYFFNFISEISRGGMKEIRNRPK